jgi:hypothetical protein
MEKVSSFGGGGHKAEITNGTVMEEKMAGAARCEPIVNIGAPGRN